MNKTTIYGLIGVIVLIAIIGLVWIYTGQEKPEQPPTTEEPTKVTIMMPFTKSSQWTQFYTALNKGYYKDEGLDVKILYTNEGGFGAIKQVAAGNVDFGYASGDSLILARSKDMPVKSVYQAHHNHIFSIITKKSSGINELGELAGKTIATASPGNPAHIVAQYMLKKAGVDYDKQNFVYVGAAMLPSLLQDKAEAITGIPLFEVLLEKQGVEYNIWRAKDNNANFVPLTILTTENIIKNNPGLVRKFVRASHKGLEYAVKHPEEAVDEYIKNFNPDAIENRDVEVKQWKIFVDEAIQPDKYPLGKFNKEQWTMTQNSLYDTGIIDKKTPISEMYTDKFLPK